MRDVSMSRAAELPVSEMIPGAIPPLTDLHLRLTSRCHLNCRHCYAADWFGRPETLSTSLVCDAIDEALDLGLEQVTFTGGEPLMHPGLVVMLQHCLARRVPAKLETSGLLLARKGNPVRELLVAHRRLLHVYVSYDLAAQRGLSARAHERVRALVIELHECRVDVRLQTTLTGINIAELDALTALSREYGIRQRIFFDHSLLGKGASLVSLDLDRVLATYRYLAAQDLNLDLELPALVSGRVQKGCGWGLHRCEIMPNADVTTCAPVTFTHTGFVAGNLTERPLAEIWRRSDYFVAMREVRQTDFQGVCRRCVYWPECRGSCRAYAWSRGSDWFSPYPLCQAYADRYPERVVDRLLVLAPTGSEAGAEGLRGAAGGLTRGRDSGHGEHSAARSECREEGKP